MNKNKTNNWNCEFPTLFQSHRQSVRRWLWNKVENSQFQLFVLFLFISWIARWLYFSEFVSFYIFLNFRLCMWVARFSTLILIWPCWAYLVQESVNQTFSCCSSKETCATFLGADSCRLSWPYFNNLIHIIIIPGWLGEREYLLARKEALTWKTLGIMVNFWNAEKKDAFKREWKYAQMLSTVPCVCKINVYSF